MFWTFLHKMKITSKAQSPQIPKTQACKVLIHENDLRVV